MTGAGEPASYRTSQAIRNTEIGITFGCAAATNALILRVFDQRLVLLLIAEMKALRYDIAQMLAMHPRAAL